MTGVFLSALHIILKVGRLTRSTPARSYVKQGTETTRLGFSFFACSVKLIVLLEIVIHFCTDQHLIFRTSDYPLFPENLVITEDMISPKSRY